MSPIEGVTKEDLSAFLFWGVGGGEMRLTSEQMDRLYDGSGFSGNRHIYVLSLCKNFKISHRQNLEDIRQIAFQAVFSTRDLWVTMDERDFKRFVKVLVLSVLTRRAKRDRVTLKREQLSEPSKLESELVSEDETGSDFEAEDYFNYLTATLSPQEKEIARLKLMERRSGAAVAARVGLTRQYVNRLLKDRIWPVMVKADLREKRRTGERYKESERNPIPMCDRARNRFTSLEGLSDREIELLLNITRYLRVAETPQCVKAEDLEGCDAGGLPSQTMKNWDRRYWEPLATLRELGWVKTLWEYSTHKRWCRIWQVRRLGTEAAPPVPTTQKPLGCKT